MLVLFFFGGGGQKSSPIPLPNILVRRRRKIFGGYWKKHLNVFTNFFLADTGRFCSLQRTCFFYNLFGLVTSETVERREVPFSKHFAAVFFLKGSFPADFLGAQLRLKFYTLKLLSFFFSLLTSHQKIRGGERRVKNDAPKTARVKRRAKNNARQTTHQTHQKRRAKNDAPKTTRQKRRAKNVKRA